MEENENEEILLDEEEEIQKKMDKYTSLNQIQVISLIYLHLMIYIKKKRKTNFHFLLQLKV